MAKPVVEKPSVRAPEYVPAGVGRHADATSLQHDEDRNGEAFGSALLHEAIHERAQVFPRATWGE